MYQVYRILRKNVATMLAALVLGLFLPGAISGAVLAAEATVSGLRIGESAGATRFVIDIDAKVDYQILILANPARVVIDLPEVDWRVGGSGAGQGRGLIGKYRYGLFRAGVSRLVLDLTGPAVVDRTFVLEPQGRLPFRLVFDLKATDGKTFAASVTRSRRGKPRVETVTATASRQPELRNKPKRDRKIIVIDAGHGGVDPGNLGVIGVPEKVIVLNMARAIKRAIETSSRYEVVMTRDRDIFVPLKRRPQIAREVHADLFISVHADSLNTKLKKNRKVRGATVYTLSENASDAEAAALANKENKADLIAGIDLAAETDEVRSILIDLAQRETMNYSAQFANYLLPELKERIYI
ncbi:MAG: N-acetylmuramoyl-L-alanine amidase, partial [Proteobacteria bacterium]|nr:N-acetylmuramoyl-L-alanine amidase [Pseudomonadota bacterium]